MIWIALKMLLGDKSKYFAIIFYVVPKTSLTGTNIERVDTRVVQLVYSIDPENKLVREKKVLVGQLLDVFIDTRPSASERK